MGTAVRTKLAALEYGVVCKIPLTRSNPFTSKRPIAPALPRAKATGMPITRKKRSRKIVIKIAKVTFSLHLPHSSNPDVPAEAGQNPRKALSIKTRKILKVKRPLPRGIQM